MSAVLKTTTSMRNDQDMCVCVRMRLNLSENKRETKVNWAKWFTRCDIIQNLDVLFLFCSLSHSSVQDEPKYVIKKNFARACKHKHANFFLSEKKNTTSQFKITAHIVIKNSDGHICAIKYTNVFYWRSVFNRYF